MGLVGVVSIKISSASLVGVEGGVGGVEDVSDMYILPFMRVLKAACLGLEPRTSSLTIYVNIISEYRGRYAP